MNKHKTSLEFRKDIWEAAKAAAQERRMPMVTWIENAMLAQLGKEQRYASAKEARQRKRKQQLDAAGKCCIPCGCVPAAECRFPERHNTKANWVDAELCRE